jgi:hypothetical protein
MPTYHFLGRMSNTTLPLDLRLSQLDGEATARILLFYSQSGQPCFVSRPLVLTGDSRHRPYLALFEQTLAKHVMDIAKEYPNNVKERYIAAAQRFRIP